MAKIAHLQAGGTNMAQANVDSIVVVDLEDIAPQLGGSFKGIDFVKVQQAPQANGEPIYFLRRDNSSNKCQVLSNDKVVAQIPLGISNFSRGLKAKLVKLERSKEHETVKITLPKLERKDDGSLITTLAEERKFFQSMASWRMQSIRLKEQEKCRSILNILLASSEKRIAVSESLKSRWRAVIDSCIGEDLPITLTMSLAVGTRIPNRLKFFDNVNLPTFGWLYFLFFFQMLNEKVRLVYPPGIKLVIFDEAWLFGKYLGIEQSEIEVNLRAVEKLIAAMEVPVEIILMREGHFNLAEVNDINARVTHSQIYGFLCSLPEMTNPAVMHSLYRRRSRDYDKIRLAAGDLWDKAQENTRRVAQFLTWRKKVDLFRNLLGCRYIDTTITDKDERLVLDITCSLMNHGMPVVRCNAQGLLKVDIVPEYRIPSEYQNVVPVWIKKSDLGVSIEGSFKFYYLEV